MTKDQAKKPDLVLLASVGAMLLLGILILSSASASLSQFKYDDSYYLIVHQLLMGIFPGLVFGFVAYKIPMEIVRRFALPLLAASVLFLIMIFVPGIGFAAGGAQRWIHLGVATFQPSEFLKLAFIVYLASWLAGRFGAASPARRGSKRETRDNLAAFLVVVALIGLLLIKQPDLSTFGIVAVVAFAMYFLAGTPLKHTALIGLLGLGLLALLVVTMPYRMQRLTSWLSPESDPLGKGFQSNQALIIVGSGGIFGQGLGSSSPKYTVLPELIGDSVFAPFAHEIGFFGCLLLIALFAVFAWRGFLVARHCGDKFESLVVYGVVIWICLQAFINISSTARLIPLSGVPLPFISYGGTAMAMELIAVGMVANISRRAPREE
ncbi:MAG: putative lipid II flippase FtsW [Candidatus Pacebacteria bacterium]|jgi:cell division protein FtsW|nr:putative lipid II flippase FtsW [Candidatus Paceibacterota bacterium]